MTITLDELASRSERFAFNLRRVRGVIPAWAVADSDPEIRKLAYTWIMGYVDSLADNELASLGDCQQMQAELIRLSEVTSE